MTDEEIIILENIFKGKVPTIEKELKSGKIVRAEPLIISTESRN
jgi:hypothetical protein